MPGTDALQALSAASVLGIEHSLTGRRWVRRGGSNIDPLATAIHQHHGVPILLAQVLAGRGVLPADVPAFLEPRLRDLLIDPTRLVDMDRATARLAHAVAKGHKVAIFGDYDVDGASSAATLTIYLRACGLDPRIYIPDRIIEGYGPNIPAIEALAGEGTQLLVAVDCGTSGHAPFARAAELGMDVVVLDHHQAPPELPAVSALVNPNRQDDLSGMGHLCAAGVVFLTIIALNARLRAAGFWKGRAEPDMLALLDLVALATIADVVPLQGLNRAFVRQGLSVMRQRRRPGLTALFDVAGLDRPPAAWHLGFLIGPRINAGGRIGDAALGARLLTMDDPAEAAAIAAELNGLNKERQVIEQAALEDAQAQALVQLMADPATPALIVGDANWHPGIVGLVAARLKERQRRPAFAFAMQDDGSGTGSARSVPAIDIGRLVREAVEAGAAIKGGGHAMAAGVTLPPGGLERFAEFIRERLAAGFDATHVDDLALDAVLSAGGATPDLVAALERAGPFGAGQPEPAFALPAHRLIQASIVGEGHVRAAFSAPDGATLGAIAFRCVGQPLGDALLARRGEIVHAAGTLSADVFRGTERAQLRLTDLAQPT